MKQDATRKCIATGTTMDKDRMLRFVAVENIGIVPDFKKKLGGKGIYVTNAKSILEKAINNNLFAKALKKKININEDLLQNTENLLRNQALHAISLARKAGCAIWGLDKSLEAIKKGQVAFVLEASDAGCDGHKKMSSHAKGMEIYSLFTSEELNQELNRENTAHMVFLKSPISEMVRDAFIRLTSYLNN